MITLVMADNTETSESWGDERSESLQRSLEEQAVDSETVTMNPEGVIESSRKPRVEIEEEEALDIMEMLETSMKKGYSAAQTYRYIARGLGRHPKTIENFIRRHRSTVGLAQMKLRANAAKIVDKIIDKAPTHELIDVISRPNIGVLEPAKKQELTNNGFILNVQVDSLGAVKSIPASTPTIIEGEKA